jgi:hypothetical protein
MPIRNSSPDNANLAEADIHMLKWMTAETRRQIEIVHTSREKANLAGTFSSAIARDVGKRGIASKCA